LESSVVRRKRLACLFPVIVFIALRALSHAHPAPLPWTDGVFDAGGLDDLLQPIRTASSPSGDACRMATGALAVPTGIVSPSETSLGSEAFLTAVRSRAPPSA
jgi:hypothetical protein